MDKPQDRHTYTLCTLTCQFEGNHCGCKRSSIAFKIKMYHTHTHTLILLCPRAPQPPHTWCCSVAPMV